ncbi:hypothetical protein K8R66_00370 [bacterium]|nr:hypothetical protein [bacterium]
MLTIYYKDDIKDCKKYFISLGLEKFIKNEKVQGAILFTKTDSFQGNITEKAIGIGKKEFLGCVTRVVLVVSNSTIFGVFET